MSEIKFRPKLLEVKDNPILIVGEKPGRTRDNSTYSLQGNRTGDFVNEAIGTRTNLILTNVVNVLYNGTFRHDIHVGDGLVELIALIEKFKPRKIICLGAVARDYVKSIKDLNGTVVWEMPHPSYINRFLSSERSMYIKELSNELDK